MKGTEYTTDRKEEVRKVNKKTGDVDIFYRIYATSKGGTFFHIDIPESQLTKADSLLTKRAIELDNI